MRAAIVFSMILVLVACQRHDAPPVHHQPKHNTRPKAPPPPTDQGSGPLPPPAARNKDGHPIGPDPAARFGSA